jgi:hypothetical protein
MLRLQRGSLSGPWPPDGRREQKEPQLPIFLEGMTWVDFRKEDPNPMERLIWGITGERDRGLP